MFVHSVPIVRQVNRFYKQTISLCVNLDFRFRMAQFYKCFTVCCGTKLAHLSQNLMDTNIHPKSDKPDDLSLKPTASSTASLVRKLKRRLKLKNLLEGIQNRLESSNICVSKSSNAELVESFFKIKRTSHCLSAIDCSKYRFNIILFCLS